MMAKLDLLKRGGFLFKPKIQIDSPKDNEKNQKEVELSNISDQRLAKIVSS